MDSKIIEKIKKLINHAESAKNIGSTAEAEAFAGKVSDLLDAYNLDLSDIDRADELKTEVDCEKVNHIIQTIEVWQNHLLDVIATNFGCFALASPIGLQIAIGRENDRKATIELYRYFERLAIELAEKYLESYHTTIEYQVLKTNDRYFAQSSAHFASEKERLGFLLGFVSSLEDRFAAKKYSEQTPSTSSALVFIKDKTSDAKNWARENMSFMEGTYQPRQQVSINGYFSGRDFGNRVALTDKTIENSPR